MQPMTIQMAETRWSRPVCQSARPARDVSLIAHAWFSAPRIVEWSESKGEEILITVLSVRVVLMLLGVIPAWPHSRSWGYGPSGGVGLILLVLLVLLLTGRL
jgi:hypothetical protein